MTYRETLDWMFARLPMYQQRGASALNAKLETIQQFSAYLGSPHLDFKSIHVAGTNGKGSSSHMLASVLQEAGYKTGLYTSPHLRDFRERIRVDGRVISETYVIDFIARHRDYLEAHSLSFFELTVGMAFEYFSAERVDIAVIEVGLGGRLDSTNIIIPEVSLITNIGMDHMEFLGDTLPEIAAEKAGIIKPGVPVVVSETQDEVAAVFKTVAAEREAPLIFADQQDSPEYSSSLGGKYQKRNMKGVVSTLGMLKEFPVSDADMVNGLNRVAKNTGLQGRWQTLGERPRIICDTAHNPDGLELVLEQLLSQDYKRLHIVLGFVKDKPLEKVLTLFPSDAAYYFARPDIPRGLDAEILREKALDYGLQGESYSSVDSALMAARKAAVAEDLIFVGGSTFVVAEVV
ncbi:bifunctional folylpolyglutamate synthase/dihydrofolate synthase [Robiginitalea sp.]|uniref:bifunctional folylpolyglutamate synthase/dihydrofolate synthase n=1 Tax=Robiginitalea sp. TaxID=1902411 RepID=UPI003C31790E